MNLFIKDFKDCLQKKCLQMQGHLQAKGGRVQEKEFFQY
jgi:hypothetical protein